jgi:hypothetical protein
MDRGPLVFRWTRLRSPGAAGRDDSSLCLSSIQGARYESSLEKTSKFGSYFQAYAIAEIHQRGQCGV